MTGGPGTGKSALVARASAMGATGMAEAGRAIIRDQVSFHGKAFPWKDRDAFGELMLARDVETYRKAQSIPGIVLFDRDILDIIDYRRLVGLPVPDHLERVAWTFRYDRHVFIAPPGRTSSSGIEVRAAFVMTAIDACI